MVCAGLPGPPALPFRPRMSRWPSLAARRPRVAVAIRRANPRPISVVQSVRPAFARGAAVPFFLEVSMMRFTRCQLGLAVALSALTLSVQAQQPANAAPSGTSAQGSNAQAAHADNAHATRKH